MALSMSNISILISTHAPRTGSDDDGACYFVVRRRISTHAPRTGSDKNNGRQFFLRHHFNPRSPHGERITVNLFFC